MSVMKYTQNTFSEVKLMYRLFWSRTWPVILNEQKIEHNTERKWKKKKEKNKQTNEHKTIQMQKVEGK